MVGSINKLSILFLLIVLNSCQNLKRADEKRDVYISIKGNVHYNTDTIDYYVVNKTDKDIKIQCNPNFFKRKKDSLFVNSWSNPVIEIYNNSELIEPVLLNVNYSSKILDSLEKIKERYTEIDDLNKINPLQLNILKKYFKTVKKNDSIKFSTKINFENEPRFYDFSENEGYILKKGLHYSLKICLNGTINPKVNFFLEKEGIYSQRICSNPVKLVLVKTNYSE